MSSDDDVCDLFAEQVSVDNPWKHKPIRKIAPTVHDPELLELRKITNQRVTKLAQLRPYFPIRDYHIVTAPLLELSSVSIHLDDGNPSFDIYGYISLVNDNEGGEECFVFNRECNDPVTVVRKDKKPAILHKSKLHCPFWLPNPFQLKLKLTDKIRDVTIVDAVTEFDLEDIVYDKEHKFKFNGLGMVTVHYTLFKCALSASVALTVLKNDGRSKRGLSVINDIVSGIAVRGTISASTEVESGEEVSRVIFDQELDTSMFVTPHTQLLPLAVPAYSFLRLKADLEVDGEPFVSGFALEFKPSVGSMFGRKEIVGPKWRILVVVSWACPHGLNPYTDSDSEGSSISFEPCVPPGLLQRSDADLEPEKCSADYPDSKGSSSQLEPILQSRLLEQSEEHSERGNSTTDHSEQGPFRELVIKKDNSEGSSSNIWTNFYQHSEAYSDSGDSGDSSIEEPQQKRSKLFHNRLVSEVSDQRILPLFRFLKYNRMLVEVFSIYIGSFGRTGGALQLYGKITSYDYLNIYDILKRDKMNPVKLNPHSNVAPVEQPHCYEALGACFGMYFDLKDAEGHEISKGYVQWGHHSSLGWKDKRICSVVRGKHGFAAVHYTIFEHAVSANVKVTLLSHKSDDVCQVNGKICASYSTYKYSKVYEKKYYRSMIFEKGRAEFVEVQPLKKEFVEAAGGGGVPLSKHKVAVPVDASLIVEVSLNVEGEYGEALIGEAAFNFEMSTKMSEVFPIDGQNYCLSVSVDWY